MDLLLLNAGPLAHLAPIGLSGPLAGTDILDREALTYGAGKAILIRGDTIESIAESEELQQEFAPGATLSGTTPHRLEDGPLEVWDLAGKAVIPGLVDAHTHLLWSGDRSNEVALRQQGHSYREIAEMGGGIGKTVAATSFERSPLHNRCVWASTNPGMTALPAKSQTSSGPSSSLCGERRSRLQ